jgi:hypothetical protein
LQEFVFDGARISSDEVLQLEVHHQASLLFVPCGS